jgi:hypothetical protein
MIDNFKEILRTQDLRFVYRKFLLGHKIWYFETRAENEAYAETYDEFKLYMSDKLDLHVNNLAIVGSAKLGFSLSPKNNFKVFEDDSDIDLVIVSSSLYRKAWDAFIDLSNRFHVHNYNQITNSIFRRFVSLKNPDIRNDFFKDWSRRMDPCRKDLQTIFSIPHDINYRIYESWESVERYHVAGLLKIKNVLEKNNG